MRPRQDRAVALLGTVGIHPSSRRLNYMISDHRFYGRSTADTRVAQTGAVYGEPSGCATCHLYPRITALSRTQGGTAILPRSYLLAIVWFNPRTVPIGLVRPRPSLIVAVHTAEVSPRPQCILRHCGCMSECLAPSQISHSLRASPRVRAYPHMGALRLPLAANMDVNIHESAS